MGIPLKDQSRIFEKYECASAADRNRKGGAPDFGLGLNYVFRVAEAHGGKVNVESIEGEYSEFSLSLPDETLVSYRGFQWNLLQNPLKRGAIHTYV